MFHVKHFALHSTESLTIAMFHVKHYCITLIKGSINGYLKSNVSRETLL